MSKPLNSASPGSSTRRNAHSPPSHSVHTTQPGVHHYSEGSVHQNLSTTLSNIGSFLGVPVSRNPLEDTGNNEVRQRSATISGLEGSAVTASDVVVVGDQEHGSISSYINRSSPHFDPSLQGGVHAFLGGMIKQLYEAGKLEDPGPILTIDDVDFVFVVDRERYKSLSFRLANRVAKMFGHEPLQPNFLESARKRYLDGLENEYHIKYEMLAGSYCDYYVIKLGFAHLGLLAQMLSYHRQLRTNDPNKVASKTFYFRKRGKDRFHEYENCHRRSDFEQTLRLDLTYHFLVGAPIELPHIVNAWYNALRSAGSTVDPEDEFPMHRSMHEKLKREYTLLRVLYDEVFDDWLVPHQPLRHHEDKTPEKLKFQAMSTVGCNACCARFCFPMLTCQFSGIRVGSPVKAADNEELDQWANALGERGVTCCCCCKPAGRCSKLWGFWRTWWFGNTVDCSALTKMDYENDREYLARVSRWRNAITVQRFPQVPEEAKIVEMKHVIPVKQLKDYFGERIAFFFAFCELLTITLTLPAIVGVLMFLVGCGYYSIEVYRENYKPNNYVTYVMIKACDNYATPAFAALMVLWGTTFIELWARRQAWLANIWNVERMASSELKRPPIYSFSLAQKLRANFFGRGMLYAVSGSVTVFFIAIIFSSVYLVNLLNVYAVKYCQNVTASAVNTSAMSPTTVEVVQLELTTVASNNFGLNSTTPATSTQPNGVVAWIMCNLLSSSAAILNSLSIYFLDLIYTPICYIITDWEGHGTQTSYTNALVLKLFIFRFFNYYTVLFYIAFGVSTQYVGYPDSLLQSNNEDDVCGQQPCMALLTRQLLGIIVTTPILNTAIDIVFPKIKIILMTTFKKDDSAEKPVRARTASGREEPATEAEKQRAELITELDEQYELTTLSTLDRREFTTEEYTEKVIVFGALLMFSVALPVAPALALIIMRFDLALDIGKMMTEFQRPIPIRAQGIGMWQTVVNFLTFCGVVINPLIVILTSSWGAKYDVWTRFWMFIIFEHGVFAIRMIVAFVIPDEPAALSQWRLKNKATKDELVDALVDAKVRKQKFKDVASLAGSRGGIGASSKLSSRLSAVVESALTEDAIS